jgi:hypothetical protein
MRSEQQQIALVPQEPLLQDDVSGEMQSPAPFEHPVPVSPLQTQYAVHSWALTPEAKASHTKATNNPRSPKRTNISLSSN